jgi:hypothetical protein
MITSADLPHREDEEQYEGHRMGGGTHRSPVVKSGSERMGRDSILVRSMSRSAKQLSALNSTPLPSLSANTKLVL